MSPGDQTLEYECRHENKGTDQLWCLEDKVCGFETKKATKSVHCTDTCEKHTLTHTDVTSTMSLGDETLEYECRHENKGTDQLWCLKDEVCGFEAKKATKSVHCTDTCEKHTLTHTDVTSTMSPDDQTVEYECRHENKGTDQLWCLEDEVCGFETKKATKSVHCTDTCEKHTLTHTDVTSTMSPGDQTLEYECRHENKGTDQLWCLKDEVCGFETKKATKSVHCTDTCEKHTLTHTDVTSTMSPGDQTLEYECRHENKGTDQLWCLEDEVCGFETKKATKSVHCTDTCENLSTPSPIQMSPQLCRLVTKL